MPNLINDPVFQRQVIHVRELGPNALGYFLLQLADATDARDILLRQLEAYMDCAPDLLRNFGCFDFPPVIWGVGQ